MRKIVLAISLLFLTILVYGQSISDYARYGQEGQGSVFHHMPSGHFAGTVNGVFFIQKADGAEIILDFQGGKAQLDIEYEEEEVYDVSTRTYTGFTTSGRTEIQYANYASANALKIILGDKVYQLSLIDGACDMEINHLEYTYKAEKTAEYLILRASEPIYLRTYEQNPERITLLPASTLVFAMKR
ncbi:MAG: hypothetical protein AAFV78_08675 [Bacteroidota bacterium]